MFIDLNLQTSTEEDMETCLLGVGFVRSEGALYLEGSFLDVIGVIYEELDIDTFVLKQGWHVNLRTKDTNLVEQLKPITIHPVTPNRVWA